jgi:hypothetical protein
MEDAHSIPRIEQVPSLDPGELHDRVAIREAFQVFDFAALSATNQHPLRRTMI